MTEEGYKKLMALENRKLFDFLGEFVGLCDPDTVYMCDDSDEDAEHIRRTSLEAGEEKKLAREGQPIHYDCYSDQGRDKDNTKLLVARENLAKMGNLNCMEYGEGLAETKRIAKGIMKGKTAIVKLFCECPTMSPFSIGCAQDPSANIWTSTAPMVLERAQTPMIKLIDGRVLAAGGISISDNPSALSSVEIYDPLTNIWSEAAYLSQPRNAHTLAFLADGQVLALGGAHEYDYPGSNPWTGAFFIRELESYDPGTDRWYNAGELAQPEAYAATVPLPDGRLWVTGGGAGSDMAKAWVETWLMAASVMQP